MARTKNKEIERRWRIRTVDPKRFPKRFSKVWRILQGYLELKGVSQSVRVRLITNLGKGSEAVKTGKGLVRREVDRPVPLELAEALMSLSRLTLRKTRKFSGPWQLDFFQGPLKGLFLLEREFASRSAAAKVHLPAWVLEADEVTEFLSSKDLARLSLKLAKSRGDPNKAVDLIVAKHRARR
jgi:CYTH domain-containing protein